VISRIVRRASKATPDRRSCAAAAAALVTLAACQPGSTVQQHTEALTLAADSLGQRQVQMRRFDTKEEASILAASIGVLQDLGFGIEESSASTGLVVGSKDRDAVESGQVTGQVILMLMAAAFGVHHDPVYEQNQKIRISIITQPSAANDAIVVRATFQRVIWNNKKQVTRVETLNDPRLYQEFFDRLSQSVFLTAHQI
jgi:hypothetical protein